jgi:hypothetical protein
MADRAKTPAHGFAKAARDIEALAKSHTRRPLIVWKDALPGRTREIVAKALSALRRDDLTPAQRGGLMLKISELNKRVFSKSHPMVEKIDDVQLKLDASLASGHAGAAEPLIREALDLIRRGKLTLADHMRLSLLLGEVKSKLSEASNGKGE